jgi:hypothetical protein
MPSKLLKKKLDPGKLWIVIYTTFVASVWMFILVGVILLLSHA